MSLPYAEQDLLNFSVNATFTELPLEYNALVELLDEVHYKQELELSAPSGTLPAVFHYCGPKPWRTAPLSPTSVSLIDPQAPQNKRTIASKIWWDLCGNDVMSKVAKSSSITKEDPSEETKENPPSP